MSRSAKPARGTAYRAVCSEAERFGWRVVLFAEAKRLTAIGLRFPSGDKLLLESLLHDDDLDRAAERLSVAIRTERSS